MNILKFMYDRARKGITPVVRVGCQMRDRVYQNIYSGSFLVALGTMIQVPLDSKQEHFIYMSENTLPEPMTKHQRSKFVFY